ncbi:MAG: carbohydrate-binding domain-containing protein [Prevotellaceae bacterium]|nr:carbohydrate-binding domain-containing protein [Prevotellaceae bacterium]
MKKASLLFLSLMLVLHSSAADVVHLRWGKGGVSVKPKRVEGLAVACEGGYVTIENSDTLRELRLVLSGESHDGGLVYVGSHKVSFLLSGLRLESGHGSPLDIRCGKRVAIRLKEGSENVLGDSPDTLRRGVIRTKGHLELSGGGSLTINARGGHGIRAKEYVLLKRSLGSLTINATGDGCKGIRTKGDFIMRGGEVRICTSGSYLASDTTPEGLNLHSRGFSEAVPSDTPMPFDVGEEEWEDDYDDFYDEYGEDFAIDDDMPMGPPFPMPMPDSAFIGRLKAFLGEDSTLVDNFFQMGAGMPMPDERLMQRLGEFCEAEGFMPGGPMGGGPMRPQYNGTAKGIKAQGKILVEGGTLEVSTATPGAEGLEGKQGVELRGGTVWVSAYDDAVNSNGQILFSGADVTAISQRNDAVDCNARGDGSITFTAGHVEAFSGAGPPEEGFDSDEWAIEIDGGEAFSVGSGMGPAPSLPSERTARQPYLLFQSLSVQEGDTLCVRGEDGEEVLTVRTPVSNPVNHSLVTSPSLRAGAVYLMLINGVEAQRREAQP